MFSNTFIILSCISIYLSSIILGILIYSYYIDTKKRDKNILFIKNEEIDKIINTMEKDLILNIDKYSFIEINDIINIIISIYIKNNCEYKNNDDINIFTENKRKIIIKHVKINLLINYKNDLINKIIMEKNLLNTKLTIADLRNIKSNIEEHNKGIDNNDYLYSNIKYKNRNIKNFYLNNYRKVNNHFK